MAEDPKIEMLAGLKRAVVELQGVGRLMEERPDLVGKEMLPLAEEVLTWAQEVEGAARDRLIELKAEEWAREQGTRQ